MLWMLCGCGASAPQLEVVPSVTVVACGSAATQSLSLSNTGGAPLTFRAEIAGEGLFHVEPRSGTIEPRGSLALTITATPPSSDAGKGFSTLLLLDTNDPVRASLRIPVRLDTRAVQLAFTERELDFGDLPVGVSAEMPFHARNAGTAAGEVELPGPSSDFDLAWPPWERRASFELGEERKGTARFTPSGVGERTREWSPTVTNASSCPSTGPRLRGKGVEGVVGVTPGAVSFGLVPCGGGEGLVRTFTVLNTSKKPIQFTATHKPMSIFTVVPQSGVVPPESKADVTVMLDGVPQVSPVVPDHYADEITITTDAPNDAPHHVDVHITAKGAIVTFTKQAFDIGKLLIPNEKCDYMFVKNDGNIDITIGAFASAPFTATPSLLLKVGIAGPESKACAKLAPQKLGVTIQGEVTVFGDGTPLCSPLPKIPVKVVPIARATYAATDGAADCAVALNGTVYCWGHGAYAALGDGTWMDRDEPGPVPLIDAETVTMFGMACAKRSNGDVHCWGAIPGGWSVTPKAIPLPEAAGRRLTISGGDSPRHACVLLASGKVACWGFNDRGQLGDGTAFNFRGTPVLVNGLDDAVDVMASRSNGGQASTCAVRKNGQVVCWGSNVDHALGQTDTSGFPFTTPQTVPNIDDGWRLASAAHGYCVTRQSKKVSCWGRNSNGTLGVLPPPNSSATPLDIPNLAPLLASTPETIAATMTTYCAFDSQRAAWCWGDNAWANVLLNPMLKNSPTPVALGALGANIQMIAASDSSMIAVMQDGTLRKWGNLYKIGVVQSPQTVPGFD